VQALHGGCRTVIDTRQAVGYDAQARKDNDEGDPEEFVVRTAASQQNLDNDYQGKNGQYGQQNRHNSCKDKKYQMRYHSFFRIFAPRKWKE
jgi:hypothetical protein